MRLRLPSSSSTARPHFALPTLLLAALARAAFAQVAQARVVPGETNLEREVWTPGVVLGGGGAGGGGSGGFGGSGLGGSAALQNILRNTHGSDLYTYPTDLTRGIVPKAIHSHNDYWRDVPFYSALSVGAMSIEADVWLINETLYVGHVPSALTAARTFDALYVEPLLDTLHRQNPQTLFVTNPTRNGVFDASSHQTLHLFVDFKTPSETTLPALVAALEPLRADPYYLTHYNGSAVLPGLVSVVITGDVHLQSIDLAAPRDFFVDADLNALAADGVQDGVNITADIAPIASADFHAVFGPVRGGALDDAQMEILRAQVAAAHERRVMVRYYETPGWPIGTRDAVWRTLWDEGVDLINVDDLIAGAGVWGGR